ncbi:hypothetical protein GA0115245_145121 [Streptomyces sp. di188]|nr:hypothetical protein GA0115238_110920 [Streptomyces sp. di50b]SCE51796.1 hypothetical protein GA0115245_145121 [Streptomyces sp. di188]
MRTAPLDLSDLTSADAFVRDWRGPLDILVAPARRPTMPASRIFSNHRGFARSCALHCVISISRSVRGVADMVTRLAMNGSGKGVSPVTSLDPPSHFS